MPQPAALRARRRTKSLARQIPALLFCLPLLLVLIGFRVVPLVAAGTISLQRWDGIADPKFVGFANYGRALSDPLLPQLIRVNLLVLGALLASLVLSYVVATRLNAHVFGWQVLRVLYLVPAVLSPLVIGLYWQYALGDYGPISQLYAALGLHWPGSGVLANPTTAMVAVLIAVVWAFFGFGAVVFQSALADISPDILDAAQMDGPSWLQLQRYVIIPEILPVAVFWFVVLLIAAFSSVLIIVGGFTGGGPGFATKPLELYLVNDVFAQDVYGYAAALGIILLAGVTVVVLVMLASMLRLEANFKA